jgi:hypothetical protein
VSAWVRMDARFQAACGVAGSVRLCRQMCGKSSTFRNCGFIFTRAMPQVVSGRAQKIGDLIRKVEDFPHIWRQSRREMKLQKLV